jgi:hypothetical protein
MSNSRNTCRDSGKQNIDITALLLALNVLCAGSSNSFSDFSEIFVSSLINNVLRVLAFFVEPLYNVFCQAAQELEKEGISAEVSPKNIMGIVYLELTR